MTIQLDSCASIALDNRFFSLLASLSRLLQSFSSLCQLRILEIAPLPTITLIIGVILAYFYPITKEFHEEIRLKLQEKKRI